MIKTFIVNSDSMMPGLRKGDIVEISEINSTSEIKKGEIALFEVENRTYAHRILYRGEFFFLSAGDNNIITDSPMPVSLLKGKVKFQKSFRFYFPVFSFAFCSIFKRIHKFLEKSFI